MVLVYLLPHVEFGLNGHREEAPLFTLINHYWLVSGPEIPGEHTGCFAETFSSQKFFLTRNFLMKFDWEWFPENTLSGQPISKNLGKCWK